MVTEFWDRRPVIEGLRYDPADPAGDADALAAFIPDGPQSSGNTTRIKSADGDGFVLETDDPSIPDYWNEVSGVVGDWVLIRRGMGIPSVLSQEQVDEMFEPVVEYVVKT